MKSQLSGFMDFIREQGVVGLAVGVEVGNTVDTIVDGFINPLVGLILGGSDLLEETFAVTVGDREAVFAWGAVLSALITLAAVGAVVYYIVKGLKLDKTDKKKED